MLMREDVLALLKVLIAAAWADAHVSQSEVNYIKALAQRFRLSDDDWVELEPYLEDPPTASEVDELFRDLLSRIATPLGRNEVIRHLEEILKADNKVTAEEHNFLEHYTFILREASTVELLAGRMKSLFHKRPQEHPLDLNEFVRNKILFKLRRKVGSDQITPEMNRLCLIGGLMGVVAHADGEIDTQELEEIRRQLQIHGNFDRESLDILMSIINEESVRGLDRSRLTAELLPTTTFDEKVELIDLLFAVAAANGSLTYPELEELRSISAALHLSHRQYIDAKMRARGD